MKLVVFFTDEPFPQNIQKLEQLGLVLSKPCRGPVVLTKYFGPTPNTPIPSNIGPRLVKSLLRENKPNLEMRGRKT